MWYKSFLKKATYLECERNHTREIGTFLRPLFHISACDEKKDSNIDSCAQKEEEKGSIDCIGERERKASFLCTDRPCSFCPWTNEMKREFLSLVSSSLKGGNKDEKESWLQREPRNRSRKFFLKRSKKTIEPCKRTFQECQECRREKICFSTFLFFFQASRIHLRNYWYLWFDRIATKRHCHRL